MALFIPIRYLHTQNKEENSKYVNRPKWMDFSVKVYDNIDNKINRDSILDENKGKSGIYLWFNSLNGKKYIGQSKDLGNRKQGRLIRYLNPSYLKSIKGTSLIRNAFIKYNIENFWLVILEYCPIHMLDKREQY